MICYPDKHHALSPLSHWILQTRALKAFGILEELHQLVDVTNYEMLGELLVRERRQSLGASMSTLCCKAIKVTLELAEALVNVLQSMELEFGALWKQLQEQNVVLVDFALQHVHKTHSSIAKREYLHDVPKRLKPFNVPW